MNADQALQDLSSAAESSETEALELVDTSGGLPDWVKTRRHFHAHYRLEMAESARWQASLIATAPDRAFYASTLAMVHKHNLELDKFLAIRMPTLKGKPAQKRVQRRHERRAPAADEKRQRERSAVEAEAASDSRVRLTVMYAIDKLVRHTR